MEPLLAWVIDYKEPPGFCLTDVNLRYLIWNVPLKGTPLAPPIEAQIGFH